MAVVGRGVSEAPLRCDDVFRRQDDDPAEGASNSRSYCSEVVSSLTQPEPAVGRPEWWPVDRGQDGRLGQSDINKVEAVHRSIFVAGCRQCGSVRRREGCGRAHGNGRGGNNKAGVHWLIVPGRFRIDVLTRVNPIAVEGQRKYYLLRDVVPHVAKHLGARLRYVVSPFALIDIASIAPFYATLLLTSTDPLAAGLSTHAAPKTGAVLTGSGLARSRAETGPQADLVLGRRSRGTNCLQYKN